MTDTSRERFELAYPAIVSFCVALATLLLQLVQTRIYSVVYWNHLVYFIISVALLGFGISGTWLAFGKNTPLSRFLTLPRAATGFILSALLSSLFMPQIGLSISSIFGVGYIFGLFSTYLFAVLPYFFAGWILGSIFRDHVKHIHVLYFADLTGSAVGCLLFLAGMGPLGAVLLVLAACLVVGIPLVAAQIRTPLRIIGLLLSVVLAVYLIPGHRAINLKIVPEPNKDFATLFEDTEEGNEIVWEYSEWNPISRVDVVGQSKDDFKWLFIDGTAWTGFGLDGNEPPTPYVKEKWPPLVDHLSPYFFVEDPERVLVIGAGGGADIWAALRGGAKHIDAIEINPTSYHVLRDAYRETSNEMVYSPGVNTYNEEGRSFIRRTEEQYDVIMIHGTDTYAALNAGAYVLSENYLYTVEAIKDYVSHLTDGGYLCINRWYHPAELPRLFNVCLEALYELGVENPEKHIVLHGHMWGSILVRKTAFDADKVDSFRGYVEGLRGRFPRKLPDAKGEFLFPLNDYEIGSDIAEVVREYAAYRANGNQKYVLADLDMDISPVYDDSPFFFHYGRLFDLLSLGDQRKAKRVRFNWASLTLFGLIGLTSISVVLFMYVPLTRIGREGVPRFRSHLTYFASLGISFIFVEIALMQRFTLLLGHPSRSLALVLASLLFFAGLGSLMSGSRRIDPRKALISLVMFIVATTYIYPYLIEIALSWPLFYRGLVAVALVAPLGILMGMPFPTGLRLVSRWSESAVPWMWGVNGGTTVLGSVAAILIAIQFGFTVVFLMAAFGYALAWAMYVRIGTRRQ
jgi:hypothetical protein